MKEATVVLEAMEALVEMTTKVDLTIEGVRMKEAI